VGFTKDLIDHLENEYKVDPQRIYATGFSNGAKMVYRLACELSDRIAAIAPVSGTLGVDSPKPSRPVAIIHFHGLADHFAPFKGGAGRASPNHRSVADTLAWWIQANHCQPKPVETKQEADYTVERYGPASGEKGAPIVLYKLTEGGHQWPGGVKFGSFLSTEGIAEDVNASEIIWKFFEANPLQQ